MTIPLPHASEPLLPESGQMSQRWYDFMSRLARAVNGPIPLASVTVAKLPSDPPDGWIAYASDAGGGGVPVYSRGGVWRRFDTNAEVS
jgi:hypothetical protein